MTHVALLRAVNLAGHNRVSMADLCGLLADLDLQDGRSLLASGNLLFRTSGQTTARLESLLERETRTRLGVETDFFVRTGAEWARIIDENPFPREAKRDPGHLLVICLKEAPGAAKVTALQHAISGREVVAAKGRHLYAVYPDGVGRSRLTAATIERALGTRGTGRNWNTMLKLAALC